MSGVAELLINLGYDVSGSDAVVSKTTERLSQLGAKIVIGYKAKNIINARMVIMPSIIKQDNIEVMEAREKNIPVIPRARLFLELMQQTKTDYQKQEMQTLESQKKMPGITL